MCVRQSTAPPVPGGLCVSPGRSRLSAHLNSEETEAARGQVICPKPTVGGGRATISVNRLMRSERGSRTSENPGGRLRWLLRGERDPNLCPALGEPTPLGMASLLRSSQGVEQNKNGHGHFGQRAAGPAKKIQQENITVTGTGQRTGSSPGGEGTQREP